MENRSARCNQEIRVVGLLPQSEDELVTIAPCLTSIRCVLCRSEDDHARADGLSRYERDFDLLV